VPLDIVYDPIEAREPSFTSEKHAGDYKGGLCMAQVLRYSYIPVGKYVELAICQDPRLASGLKEARKRT